MKENIPETLAPAEPVKRHSPVSDIFKNFIGSTAILSPLITAGYHKISKKSGFFDALKASVTTKAGWKNNAIAGVAYTAMVGILNVITGRYRTPEAMPQQHEVALVKPPVPVDEPATVMPPMEPAPVTETPAPAAILPEPLPAAANTESTPTSEAAPKFQQAEAERRQATETKAASVA